MEYPMIHVPLTYTASVARGIAGHSRPVVDDSPAIRVKASTVSVRRVLCAKHIVEDYRVVCIPAKHLHSRAQVVRSQYTVGEL